MHDPFPFPPPAFLTRLVTPLATSLSLPTLPLHMHELLFATLTYQFINVVLAPRLSTWLFPTIYPALPRRTRLNWDVHVVSMTQSIAINALALWVMAVDEERGSMGWEQRVWGYDGAGGMIQGFAAGYFLWDLLVCVRWVDVFGWGMLAHAVAALVVFSLGFVSAPLFYAASAPTRTPPFHPYCLFHPSSNIPRHQPQRPFVNFYGPTFILYELSSPFLNLHWFFDKLHMTGSRAQWYNGILLLASFFSCRLLWGTYQSIRVYQDVWAGLHHTGPPFASLHADASGPGGLDAQLPLGADMGMMRFAHDSRVPVWLATTYLGSNVVLNSLNFYWFGKMIETVKKRFRGPADRRGGGAGAPPSTHSAIVIVEGTEMDGREDDPDIAASVAAATGVGAGAGFEVGVVEGEKGSVTIDKRGVKVVEVHKTELRRRKD